ncbi:MAG: cob(I)yrinic acid a,c-diamide adenosyltransferase [bacterium]|nr:cob(I)yrinic acid a,c-diamide adenosyltransferase [bacterium]
MSITTKTGDDGTTALFGSKRLPKSHLQIEAYGMVDEATSFIGLVHEHVSKEDKELITTIQKTLYSIMAYLSSAPIDPLLIQSAIDGIENEIILLESSLPKLTRFILPQGSKEAAHIHIARSVVRTAERAIVRFIESSSTTPNKTYRESMIYVNRLSDFLFLLARKYSNEEVST